jgi:hypothetical protein
MKKYWVSSVAHVEMVTLMSWFQKLLMERKSKDLKKSWSF